MSRVGKTILGPFFTFASYRQLSIPREKHPERSRRGGHKSAWLWSQLDWTTELSETPEERTLKECGAGYGQAVGYIWNFKRITFCFWTLAKKWLRIFLNPLIITWVS